MFLSLGLREEAKWYLGKFSWGHSFVQLNKTLLENYSECKDSKEVLAAQHEYIKTAEDERTARRATKDYPPTSSSSSDEAEQDEPK